MSDQMRLEGLTLTVASAERSLAFYAVELAPGKRGQNQAKA